MKKIFVNYNVEKKQTLEVYQVGTLSVRGKSTVDTYYGWVSWFDGEQVVCYETELVENENHAWELVGKKLKQIQLENNIEN